MAAGILLVAAIACGHKYDYPDSFKESFMVNCRITSLGQEDYCQCALDYLQDNVSYALALGGFGQSEAASACESEVH
jgi:hypothetical protein